MNLKFQQLWDVYNARRVFFGSGFVVIGRKETISGRGDIWSSKNLEQLLASLVLLDLTQVLDSALDEKIGKRGTLEKRLEKAHKLNLISDFAGLDRLRKRRNQVAHEVLLVNKFELEKFHELVKAQLLDWQYIQLQSDVVACLSSEAEWQRNGMHASLEIEIGVVDIKTHDRRWGWNINQLLQLNSPDSPIEKAVTGSFSETSAKFYNDAT